MLGWSITVSTLSRDEAYGVDKETLRAATLATWEASIGGIDWIDDLVKAGQATQLASGGYPNLYTARAGDLLPLIESGAFRGPRVRVWSYLPQYSENQNPLVDTAQGWTYQEDQITTYPDRIAACPPDRSLTITVWDLS